MIVPLRVDVPMSRRPWVNYLLIAVTVFVSLAAFDDVDLLLKLGGIEVTGNYGLPNDDIRLEITTKDFPLPVLAMTSTLVHSDWLHLLGNMLFLWIFGNAINYKFGHIGYAALYAAAAVISGLVHYAASNMPGIGASGAIYGVMGAFLVFFPRNDITILWFLLIYPRVSRISSMWIIAFWVAWDVLFLVIGSTTRVALSAHVGGFVLGFSVAIFCAKTGFIKPTEDEQTLLQVFGR